ncbi:MAG: hypothetical protein EA419_10360 [Wenzhouxiangella sp.]|nr:MAG: hypothetical protein EA419_10360 [Wenzhouxiangella sp.]
MHQQLRKTAAASKMFQAPGHLGRRRRITEGDALEVQALNAHDVHGVRFDHAGTAPCPPSTAQALAQGVGLTNANPGHHRLVSVAQGSHCMSGTSSGFPMYTRWPMDTPDAQSPSLTAARNPREDSGNGVTNSRCVFVIGAGRSGTSTLARALASLGVDLGNNFKRATRKNPTGFFEDADLLAISKAVRNRIGVRADSVRLIRADELRGAHMNDLHARAVEIIDKRFGSSPIWGFKYGRTLRILPFWEPVLAELNVEPTFVIALRNPLSVARSRARLDPRRGLQAASDLEWLIGIVPYLRRTRPYRLAVVDYDDLMDEPVKHLTRLAGALDLPRSSADGERIRDYAERFLDPGLRHTRFSDADLDASEGLNPIVRNAYRLLRQRSLLDPGTTDEVFWQQWREVERDLQALAPILDLIDLRENERRRAITSLKGPLQSFALLEPWWKNR